MIQIKIGNCRKLLKEIPRKSIQSTITSPPYYGLRDYGTASWIGGDPNCPHKKRLEGDLFFNAETEGK